MPITYPNKNTGDQFKASEANEVKSVVNANETAISNKADLSHNHVPADITGLQAEVSLNSDVQANTIDRHSHANKTLLDSYAQTEVNLADAVSKRHSQNTDTVLDQGGGNETSANEIRTHIDNDDLHRTINDTSYNTSSLWSGDGISKHVGSKFVALSDSDLSYSFNSHTNRVIDCSAPTANRTITIDTADVSKDDTFKVIAKTDSGFEYRIAGTGMTLKSPSDGSTLSSPYSMSDGLHLIHIDNTNNVVWILRFGEGSGGTSESMSFFEAFKSGAKTLTTAGGWTDVDNWTQGSGTDTSVFSFNTTTGELTINATAPALFVMDIGLNNTANDRVEGWLGLSINTGSGHSLATKYTHPFYATRNATVDEAGRPAVLPVSVTAGDKFKFQAKVEVNDVSLPDEMARFYVVLLTGKVGPAGPAGGNEKLDGVFRIQNTADNTKEVDFDVSAVSTGTKRTITMPDSDVDLGAIGSGYSGGTYTDATNGTGWTDTSGAFQCRKDSDGVVHVVGWMFAGSGSGVTIGTLPSGYRPARTSYQTIVNTLDESVCSVQINTSGTIVIKPTSAYVLNDYYCLDGIYFDT